MRCEANVSVRPAGSEELGTKVEVKNLNSFRSVKQALEYEIERQAQVLDAGGAVRQVTMGWDERQRPDRRAAQQGRVGGLSLLSRARPAAAAHLRSWVDEIRAAAARTARCQAGALCRPSLACPPADADVLAADREVADYFEAAVAAGRSMGIAPKAVSNWVTGELFRLLRGHGCEIGAVHVNPNALADLIALVEKGTITANSGKAVLVEMFDSGPASGRDRRGAGPGPGLRPGRAGRRGRRGAGRQSEQVTRYRDGKETLLGWFVGQVMRATRGKANPQSGQEPCWKKT